jgi:hypothetical protein
MPKAQEPLVITHKCPKCDSQDDVYDVMVKRAKEAGIVAKDFNQPVLRQIVIPLVAQQTINLMLGVKTTMAAPSEIEIYRTCGECGTYYLCRAEIISGQLESRPQSKAG